MLPIKRVASNLLELQLALLIAVMSYTQAVEKLEELDGFRLIQKWNTTALERSVFRANYFQEMDSSVWRCVFGSRMKKSPTLAVHMNGISCLAQLTTSLKKN